MTLIELQEILGERIKVTMKKVYIAHPYLGKRRNKKKVERLIKGFVKEGSGVLYISPIHTIGFLYFDMEYYQGMKSCLELLKMCDELWLCEGWEKSEGCRIEKEFAERTAIPIRYL